MSLRIVDPTPWRSESGDIEWKYLISELYISGENFILITVIIAISRRMLLFSVIIEKNLKAINDSRTGSSLLFELRTLEVHDF
jgi:hypothetical protein